MIINFTSEVIAGAIDVFTVLYTFPRILIAVVASFFPDANIAVLGVWMAILFNVSWQPFYIWLTDVEKRIKGVYFVVLNVPLNFFIFKLLGVPVYAMLRAIV